MLLRHTLGSRVPLVTSLQYCHESVNAARFMDVLATQRLIALRMVTLLVLMFRLSLPQEQLHYLILFFFRSSLSQEHLNDSIWLTFH